MLEKEKYNKKMRLRCLKFYLNNKTDKMSLLKSFPTEMYVFINNVYF